jgi:hypothetical protein
MLDLCGQNRITLMVMVVMDGGGVPLDVWPEANACRSKSACVVCALCKLLSPKSEVGKVKKERERLVGL